MKEIEKYEPAVDRLCSFIEAICPESRESADEVVARDEGSRTTPAERLLMEKSGGHDAITSPQDVRQELSIYNNLSKPPVNEPILKFWSDNESVFPLLSIAARVTLSVPCSSATIERSFKVGVHQVTNHRSRLDPVMVEGLIITKANEGRVDMTGMEDEYVEVSSSESSDDDSNDEDVNNVDDDINSNVLDVNSNR